MLVFGMKFRLVEVKIPLSLEKNLYKLYLFVIILCLRIGFESLKRVFLIVLKIDISIYVI